ncbi:MAG: hypothetical protein Q9209_005699 [Squamulea sp. 1 TL-2023]
MANLASFNEVLAGTERVLHAPLPIAYSIAISQITWVYVIMLPFQLWHALRWITIPGTIVGAYIILGIAAIGREIENPFGRDENDLPLDKFCEGLEDELNVITSKKLPRMEDFIATEDNSIRFDSRYPSLATKSTDVIRAGLKARTNVRAGPRRKIICMATERKRMFDVFGSMPMSLVLHEWRLRRCVVTLSARLSYDIGDTTYCLTHLWFKISHIVYTSSSLTYSSPSLPPSLPDLRLLHFNDVYHIECGSAEPVGGIARFQTLRNFYADDERFKNQPKLITLFSGDAFNPSLESSVTKGAHMVPVLNGMLGKEGRGAACVGNHDLDFGVLQFRHLRSQCTFPWLLANVLDPALGEDVALGDCEKTKILESSNGIKIGLIGLAEREWLDTINSLPPNLIYRSASETAKALIPSLRDQGADIIIALTHAREPSDVKLAEKTPPGLIDLILGGHDHFYGHQKVNGAHILRSGTDFKNLSYIEAYRQPSSPFASSTQPNSTSSAKWSYRITRRDITRSIPSDPTTLDLVSKLTSTLKSKLEKQVGYTFTPLDARFTTVRTQESNLGNFVCDLMRHTYSTDCALMAGGTIRGDQVYPPGVLRLKDIMNCFPFEDPVVVIRVKGSAIRAALENSVALVPALEGRYSQVSGMRFCYSPSAPPGARVKWVEVADGPLDEAREYTMATRGYMGRGKDGFTSLLVRSEDGEAEEIVSEENGILISMILRQYFMSLKVLGRWNRWGPSMGRHWGGVQEKLHKQPGMDVVEPKKAAHKHTRSGNVKDGNVGGEKGADADDSDDDDAADVVNGTSRLAIEAGQKEQRETYLARRVLRHWMRLTGIKSAGLVEDGMENREEAVPDWTKGIAPKLEGRIVIEC